MKLTRDVQNKKVLFVTTKNVDYIRNTQELRLLKEKAKSVIVVASKHHSYLQKIPDVLFQICKIPMEEYEVVFLGFAPQLVLPVFKSRWIEKRIVIDFFISMQDTLTYDRKIVLKSLLLDHILHEWDKWTLQEANLILADTKEHGQFFTQKFQADFRKIEILYLEADQNIYYPVETELVKKTAQHDRYTVLYFGTGLPLQGMDIITEAACRLCDQKQIEFVFIGNLKKKEYQKLEKYRASFKAIKWLSQEQLAETIARADLCLAGHFNASVEKAKRTIPGKAVIYEAMNKPMILGDNRANHELFREDERHFFIEMGNATALAEKIKETYRAWSLKSV